MSDTYTPQPAPQQAGPPTVPSQGSNGLATAGFVLALLGFLGAWIPVLNILGIILAVIGLILAAVGLRQVQEGPGRQGLASLALSSAPLR